jgi:hypothetical protein
LHRRTHSPALGLCCTRQELMLHTGCGCGVERRFLWRRCCWHCAATVGCTSWTYVSMRRRPVGVSGGATAYRSVSMEHNLCAGTVPATTHRLTDSRTSKRTRAGSNILPVRSKPSSVVPLPKCHLSEGDSLPMSEAHVRLTRSRARAQHERLWSSPLTGRLRPSRIMPLAVATWHGGAGCRRLRGGLVKRAGRCRSGS